VTLDLVPPKPVAVGGNVGFRQQRDTALRLTLLRERSEAGPGELGAKV